MDSRGATGPTGGAGARQRERRSLIIEKPAPQPIEIGAIEAANYEDAPGRGVVVWLECL